MCCLNLQGSEHLVQGRERKALNIGNWLASQGSLVLTVNSTGMQTCRKEGVMVSIQGSKHT